MLFNPMQTANLMEGALKTYWRGFDSVARSSTPQAKAVVRSQIELGGFVTRRMKSGMELSHRMGRCSSPVDAVGEMASFWMDYFEDFAETSQRSMQIFGISSPAKVSRIQDWQPPMSPADVETKVRDTLELEPKPAPAADQDAASEVEATDANKDSALSEAA